jgi:flagellar hook-length control protein FliK
MSTSIAPTFGPGAAASPVSSSSSVSGARGRSADEPDGRNFHAVLERSRGGSAPPSDDASPLEGAARRKPGRGTDRREELAAEPLPLAFFAPMPGSLPAAGLPAGTPVAAGGAQAATPGLVTDAAAAGDVPAADAGTAVAAADAAASSSTQAQPADAPAQAAPLANGDKAKPDAQTAAAMPADAITQPAVEGEAEAVAAEATAVPVPVANAARAATPNAAAADLPIPAQDDAAATSNPADVVARAAELPAQGPATPAASIVLGASPSMALDSARTSVPPASVHTPTLTVEPSVGSEAWGRAIGQQVLRMSAAGYQVAELNLNPAGLGPLKVTLSMADNQAQAMFFSAHESVRRAVEAAMPQLRASMADSGISLGQASVGAEAHHSPGQGGALGQDAQQQQQQQASARRADRPAFGAEPAAAAAQAAPLGAAAAPRRSNAAVDTFA